MPTSSERRSAPAKPTSRSALCTEHRGLLPGHLHEPAQFGDRDRSDLIGAHAKSAPEPAKVSLATPCRGDWCPARRSGSGLSQSSGGRWLTLSAPRQRGEPSSQRAPRATPVAPVGRSQRTKPRNRPSRPDRHVSCCSLRPPRHSEGPRPRSILAPLRLFLVGSYLSRSTFSAFRYLYGIGYVYVFPRARPFTSSTASETAALVLVAPVRGPCTTLYEAVRREASPFSLRGFL